jgi:hypothetical protein
MNTTLNTKDFMANFNDSTSIATPEQFRAAILTARQKMTPVQFSMLQAHCRAEAHTTTTFDLADLLKLDNPFAARIAYWNYARLIAEALKFVPPLSSNKPVWMLAIAYGVPDSNGKMDGEFQWIMRPELVGTLQAMNWA